MFTTHSYETETVPSPPWLYVDSILCCGGSSTIEKVDSNTVVKWLHKDDMHTVVREIVVHKYMAHTDATPRLYKLEARGDYFGLYMERCPHTLYSILKTDLTYEDRVSIAYELIKSLRVLHHNGFTHQDIKTTNIGVFPPNQKGGRWRVCLFDFGLTMFVGDHMLFLDTELYWSGTIAESFTTHARPPELLLGSMFRRKANDIWALGVVLVNLFHYEGYRFGEFEENQEPLLPKNKLYLLIKYPKQLPHSLSQLSKSSNWENTQIPSSTYQDRKLYTEQTMNMIDRCLVWCFRERPTCADLLDDPLFSHIPRQVVCTTCIFPRELTSLYQKYHLADTEKGFTYQLRTTSIFFRHLRNSFELENIRLYAVAVCCTGTIFNYEIKTPVALTLDHLNSLIKNKII
jgi:serine/threonine protein kinase